MIPRADDVARAIIAASRECGADPEAVAKGDSDRKRGRHAGEGDQRYPISRARSYAAKALAAVFTDHWRTRIAGYVGARGLSRQSFFSALDQRIRSPAGGDWWDVEILARVVGAIQAGILADHCGITLEVQALPDKPKAESVKRATPEKIAKILPAVSYRAPAGTAAAVLADDADDGPVFDVGGLGQGFQRREARPRVSKAEMEADLRAAVERTAAMQPKED